MKIQLKPVVTEKAVMMIESQNILTFQTGKEAVRNEIKREIEDLFKVKIEKIRTLIRGNKKYVYVRLKPQFAALDIATKLGIM
jgi:large subunit ribosomal protein L23